MQLVTSWAYQGLVQAFWAEVDFDGSIYGPDSKPILIDSAKMTRKHWIRAHKQAWDVWARTLESTHDRISDELKVDIEKGEREQWSNNSLTRFPNG